MHSSGINHVCITMEGTKKADIPESVMSTILETVLNPQNHPLLVHCNQGRVCNVCLTASTTTDTFSSTALDAPSLQSAKSWAGQSTPSSLNTLPTPSRRFAKSTSSTSNAFRPKTSQTYLPILASRDSPSHPQNLATSPRRRRCTRWFVLPWQSWPSS